MSKNTKKRKKKRNTAAGLALIVIGLLLVALVLLLYQGKQLLDVERSVNPEPTEEAKSRPEPTPEPTSAPTPEPTPAPTEEPAAPEITPEPTPEPTPAPTPEPADLVSVSFYYGDKLLHEFKVPKGQMLPEYDPILPGLTLSAWIDEDGRPADPWGAPVTAEHTYTASTRRSLSAHSAYLTADGDDFLRPDEPLAADELRYALDQLLPGNNANLDVSDEERAAIRGETLRTVLSAWYTEEELAAVKDGPVSRRDFAKLIAGLSGWQAEEKLVPAAGTRAPVDLPPADPDYELLLEASVAHWQNDEGSRWSECGIGTGAEKGVLLHGTDLYAVGDDGLLIRGGDVGWLHFGEDGRFSSGDEELDADVTQFLAMLQEQYPEDAGDRFAMLRHVYDHMRYNFQYLGRGDPTENEDWVIDAAKIMFETNRGNCYNYAAAFRAAARRLGYQANTICRTLDTPDNTHCWTDIVIKGIPYVFDPQLEQHFGNDRWMLRYEDAAQYGYSRPDPSIFHGYEPYSEMYYEQPPEQQGEVIRADGEGYDVYLIYLPYGYDPSKQYNVLIYLNGADGDPYKMLGTDDQYSHGNTYFGKAVNTKYYIDWLIQEGYCDPLIVVSCNETIAYWIGDRYLRLIQYTVDNYSTYAASSEVEDLIAARDHFAIAGPSNAAQSICCAIQTMPDIFAYYGLFSGLYQPLQTLDAFKEKGEIKFLMMSAGDIDYQNEVMTNAYETWSQLDNVYDSCLMIVPHAEHDWTAFDAAIRYMLFYFSPKTK